MKHRLLGRTRLRLSPFGPAIGGAAVTPLPDDGPPVGDWCDVPADLAPEAWRTLRPHLATPEPIIVGRFVPSCWGERMAPSCEKLLATLGRRRIDVLELEGFDLERIKAGEPFQRAMALRDRGRARFFGVRVKRHRDAMWIIEHSPAHVVTLDAPLAEEAWSEIVAAAVEAETGLIATAAAVGGDVEAARRRLDEGSVTAFSWPVAANQAPSAGA